MSRLRSRLPLSEHLPDRTSYNYLSDHKILHLLLSLYEHNNPDHIRSEMVLEKKKFIKSESEELWKLTEELIQESVEKGLYS